jgi:hypothetical protein
MFESEMPGAATPETKFSAMFQGLETLLKYITPSIVSGRA